MAWVPASELRNGAILLGKNGKKRRVVSVSGTKSERSSVYNFEVADAHNYFVGNVAVLVHNTSVLDENSVVPNAVADAGSGVMLFSAEQTKILLREFKRHIEESFIVIAVEDNLATAKTAGANVLTRGLIDGVLGPVFDGINDGSIEWVGDVPKRLSSFDVAVSELKRADKGKFVSELRRTLGATVNDDGSGFFNLYTHLKGRDFSRIKSIIDANPHKELVVVSDNNLSEVPKAVQGNVFEKAHETDAFVHGRIVQLSPDASEFYTFLAAKGATFSVGSAGNFDPASWGGLVSIANDKQIIASATNLGGKWFDADVEIDVPLLPSRLGSGLVRLPVDDGDSIYIPMHPLEPLIYGDGVGPDGVGPHVLQNAADSEQVRTTVEAVKGFVPGGKPFGNELPTDPDGKPPMRSSAVPASPVASGLLGDQDQAVKEYLTRVNATKFRAPMGTVHGRFQAAVAGPYEYRIPTEGTTLRIDGFAGKSLVEAKYVYNPTNSPYVLGSFASDIRTRQVRQATEYEFVRYGTIIDDSTTPFDGLAVVTNRQEAVPFFQGIIDSYGIPGVVVVQPWQDSGRLGVSAQAAASSVPPASIPNGLSPEQQVLRQRYLGLLGLIPGDGNWVKAVNRGYDLTSRPIQPAIIGVTRDGSSGSLGAGRYDLLSGNSAIPLAFPDSINQHVTSWINFWSKAREKK